MKPYFFYLAICFCILGCQPKEKNIQVPAQSPAIEENVKPIFHPSHEPKKQMAPFSDVVQVGNMYFLSGQIGMDHTTRTLVEGGVKEQTIQTLENIKAVLAHHDLKMTQVVKAMVVLDNIEDFKAFNEVYTTYFPQKPARTTFAAEALAVGAKIEIEVVAVKN